MIQFNDAVPGVWERYHLIYYKHLTWHMMRQHFYNNQETVENNNMSSTKAIEKTA